MSFRTLCVYINEVLEIIDNYEICIDTTDIRHKYNKNILTQQYTEDGYKRVVVRKDEENRSIFVARAMLSTFVGPPSDPTFTAEHKNKKRDDNRLDNLIWASNPDQIKNRDIPTTNNGCRLVVYEGVEKTVKEWSEKLNLSVSTIKWRVKNKTDWAYKTYDNLPEEVWKTINYNTEVSSLGRVGKLNTTERRIYETYEICRSNGYPVLNIKNSKSYLHVLIFKTFYSEEYANKSFEKMVLHKNDNKLDCSVDNLYLGDAVDNTTDAHNNGKFVGKKKERRKCRGVDIVTEEERFFDSLPDAVCWLKNNGYNRAAKSSISRCLDKKLKKTYGHKWYDIDK